MVQAQEEEQKEKEKGFEMKKDDFPSLSPPEPQSGTNQGKKKKKKKKGSSSSSPPQSPDAVEPASKTDDRKDMKEMMAQTVRNVMHNEGYDFEEVVRQDGSRIIVQGNKKEAEKREDSPEYITPLSSPVKDAQPQEYLVDGQKMTAVDFEEMRRLAGETQGFAVGQGDMRKLFDVENNGSRGKMLLGFSFYIYFLWRAHGTITCDFLPLAIIQVAYLPVGALAIIQDFKLEYFPPFVRLPGRLFRLFFFIFFEQNMAEILILLYA